MPNKSNLKKIHEAIERKKGEKYRRRKEKWKIRKDV